MLYLSDDMFKKNKTIKIIVGKPIPYRTLDAHLTQEETDCIKQKVYDLV